MSDIRAVQFAPEHEALWSALAHACAHAKVPTLHTVEIALSFAVKAYIAYAATVQVPESDAKRMFSETAEALWLLHSRESNTPC